MVTSPQISIKVRKGKIAVGDAGARDSIQEVARLAWEYRNDVHVRAWTVQTLHKAEQAGIAVNTPLEIAGVLLHAVQTEFTYVHDPDGTEMIVAPQWLVQKFIPGGDCDCKTLLQTVSFLSALASAKVRCAVVGQSFSDHHGQEHILGAIHYEDAWYYADGATRGLKLGQRAPGVTWEVVYDPKDHDKPFCDAESCLIGPNAVDPPARRFTHGDFVGVAGAPQEVRQVELLELGADEPEMLTGESLEFDPAPVYFTSTEADVPAPAAAPAAEPAAEPTAPPPVASVQAVQVRPYAMPALVPSVPLVLAPVEPAQVHATSIAPDPVNAAWADYLTTLLGKLKSDVYALNDSYENFRLMCNDMGLSFPPVIPGISFGASEQALVAQLQTFYQSATVMIEQVLDGTRPLIFTDLNGVSTPGFGAIATDTTRWVAGKGMSAESLREFLPQMVPASEPNPGGSSQVGVAGAGVVIAVGVLVVLALPWIFDAHGANQTLQDGIRSAESIVLGYYMKSLAEKGWKPEEVDRFMKGIKQGQVNLRDADTRRLEAQAEVIRAEKERAKVWWDGAMVVGGMLLIGGAGVWLAKNTNLLKGKDSPSETAPTARMSQRFSTEEEDSAPTRRSTFLPPPSAIPRTKISRYA